jgi:hypothetical protein
MAMQVQAKMRAMTRINKVKSSFQWFVGKAIVGAVKEGEKVSSPQYNVKLHGETTTWEIELYPKGYLAESGKSVSMFLCPVKVANPTKTKIRLNISFMKAGELYYTKTSKTDNEILVSDIGNAWGWAKFCSFEQLENVFVNGEVTVVVDLTIRNVDDDQVQYNVEDMEKTFTENMKTTQSHSNFSDFTVKCGDQTFPCHKVVLASRSDVLCAMLNNETEEKIENTTEIKDASPENVKSMLDYVYTGNLPEDIDDSCGEILYLAAKYHLPELVKACEVALLNSLCEGNALATLVIIDRHCPESSSRSDVIKFIATRINDIIGTDDWGKLGKDHFNLFTEIVKCMADANKVQEAEQKD